MSFVEGETPPQNNHHVFWERRHYNTPIEKRIRNLGAFVVPIRMDWHDDLHAYLPEPPKPEPESLHGLYDFMREHDYELGTTDGLEWALIYFTYRDVNEPLAEHLDRQWDFIHGEHHGA